MLDETLDQPYVGYVLCRPYYGGQDAASAIAHLRRIAAALCASRLLVVWEESDLRTSIVGPSENHPNGLAVLDATFTAHALTWYPFRYDVTGHRPSGGANLQVSWGRRTSQADVSPPNPIPRVLSSWRLPEPFGTDGVEHTITKALDSGNEIDLVQP